MRHKAFDLLAGGFAEGLGAAEIDRVRLDQVGIELVLADELAEAVTDLGAAVAIAIDRLRRRSWIPVRAELTPLKDPISSTEQMPMP